MHHGTLGIVLAAALALTGCSGVKSQVLPEEAVNFDSYHHVGVLAFTDKKGKGKAVADAINAVFQGSMDDPVDTKALEKILANHKPDRDVGYGIEVLEAIRAQTGADAIIMGRVAPDWSAVSVTMVETTTGAPILHAILRPRDRHKKVFATPEDVAKEFALVYAKLR